MIDTTQVVDTIADSLAVVQNVAQSTQTLGTVLNDIAPLLYFIGGIIVLATAFFIWDSRKNK